MPTVFEPSRHVGFGNFIFHLYEYVKTYGQDALIHSSVKDYERGKAFIFNLNITDQKPDVEVPKSIIYNPFVFNDMGEVLPKLMTPSQTLLNFDRKFKTGIHIRCGAGISDCGGLSGLHDSFVSEDTFNTLDCLIPTLPTPIFLASDSQHVKVKLKTQWGDRIEIFNSEITLTCDPATCGGVKQTSQGLIDAYTEWYILSQCEKVVTTSGPGFSTETQTGAGMSTYGFTAAAYGKKKLLIIRSDGALITM